MSDTSAGDAAPNSATELKRKVQLGGSTKIRRWATRILVLFAIVGAVIGYLRWREAKSAANVPTYETKPVVRGALRGTVGATGTVQGRDTVQIGAQVSGTIKSVKADYNDPVTVGQVLAEIDPDQFSAAVDQANAQIASAFASRENAVAAAEEAKATAARNQVLATKGLISQQELELSNAQVAKTAASIKSAAAQIQSASAALASAKANLDQAVIKSPMDGVVLDRTVEVGQTLASSLQTPVLFTLARDLKEMELSVPIDEADIGQVKEGQKATFTVDAFPTRKFDAEIKLLRNVSVVTDNVVTYEALLRVDNEKGTLRPGMTATATIVTEERTDAILVPNAALRFSPPETAKQRDAKADGMRMFGSRQRGGRPKGSASARPDGSGPPGGGGEWKRGKGEEGGDGENRGTRGNVWILEGGEPKQVTVRLGISDGQNTEVLRGLEEGAEVIVDMVEAEE